MRYCKKCVMPDTRPGIQFNKDGVCSACQAYENRKNIDWTKRMEEFQALCDRHRGGGGPPGTARLPSAAARTAIFRSIT